MELYMKKKLVGSLPIKPLAESAPEYDRPSKKKNEITTHKKIGEKTIFEKKIDQKNSKLTEAKSNDFVKKLLNTFEDAKLVEVESGKE